MKSKWKRVSREDIVREVFLASKSKIKIRMTDVDVVLNAFTEAIKNRFQSGNMVEIRGFGTFLPNYKKSRIVIHPRTKEEKRIPNRVTLKFKPSRQMIREIL